MPKLTNRALKLSKPLLATALQPRVAITGSCSLLLLVLFLSTGVIASELPPGTNLEIRLLSATGSRISHRGDRIRALVIAPVVEGGAVAIPQGAILSGSVVSVDRLGFGFRHCIASIQFVFDSLEMVDQAPVAIAAGVLEVETAKERVNSNGVVGGIHPAVNLSSGVSILVSALLMQPGLSVPVLGVKFLLARSPDPEIYFPAGTEMIVRLNHPVRLPSAIARDESIPQLSIEDEIRSRDFLAKLPRQQSESKPNRPSDLANLLILGKQDQIDRAFRAAGWTGAHAHNALAVYRMFHCVVQRAGYSMAPMTRLRLNGVPQQADYQKSLDTFAKRHHLRLWKQDGSDTWLSAASEDVSFTVDKMLISHASDGRIDNERAKVVNDLSLTGCISSAGMMSRDDLRVETEGAQDIVTDGKIAVLRLNDCQNPTHLLTPERHPVPSKIARISGAIARDFVRSNPLSLAVNIGNMVVNQQDAKSKMSASRTDRQPHRIAASQALLSHSWKRPSVVDTPVSLATSSTASTSP